MRRFGLVALCFCVISGAISSHTVGSPPPPDKLAFWDVQRKGTNCFNLKVDRQYFAGCRAAGIGLVRLTWSKWTGGGRDFLLGDADHFEGIPPSDLATLRRVLDDADAEGIRLVLTPLSLPGLRWRQQNGGKFDDRLWRDESYHRQAAAFWRELAGALRDHPAVVGYNLINEPAPARALKVDLPDAAAREAFEKRVANTPADLNRLYRALVGAVRAVDPKTPILLDATDFAAPEAIAFLRPLDEDARTLYAVHCYTPWTYTTFRKNGGKRRYPGVMEIDGRQERWDRAALQKYLAQVDDWAKRNRVPANRIVVAEFGCDRRVAGAQRYLADLIDVINGFGWHWMFYAFREDEWDGLDYEVGTGRLPWSYWQAVERGEHPAPPRKDNPLWNVIHRQFAPGENGG
jgi:hypothetical protein